MTEQESPAAPRPDAHHIRAWGPKGDTDPRAPRARPHDADPQVGRVAACALGLAYAQREDVDGLRELVAIAEADEQILTAARHRLAAIDVVDDATRRRADTLLYTAIGHRDRLLT